MISWMKRAARCASCNAGIGAPIAEHRNMGIRRAAAERFHRHPGAMSDHHLAGVGMGDAVRSPLSELAGQRVERLGTRMSDLSEQ
jgi:hypothetical protein